MPVAPADVWAWIADPDSWPGWNPKIQIVRRNRKGPIVVGEIFHAVFKLRERELPSEVEVLQSESEALLVVRQSYTFKDRLRSVDITFQLQPTRSGTRLIQKVNLKDTGIPWPFRLLIGYIHRFGRPNGTSALEELRSHLVNAVGAEVDSRQPTIP